MLLIGQWILFGVVVLLGIMLLWYAASYIFRLAVVLLVAALIVYGLHRFSLLPEPAQKYIDELFSQDLAQKLKLWIHQQSDKGNEEKTTEDDINVRS
jgi:cobalamin biosynthesis protein CobD/CbiB